MRHHFRHPQAMFNKGSLFYSHCGQTPIKNLHIPWSKFLIGEYGGFWSEFDQYTDWTRIKIFDQILTSNPINKISNVWSGMFTLQLSWFGEFGQTMGTGHYYFDEMRSSFYLVQNQLFALTKLIIYTTNCLNLSNRTSSSAEKGNVK
jgi:hypothetical protein